MFIFFMIIVFFFQLSQIFKFNIYVSSDDFGYIADTVFFAGNSWNPYTGDITPYYPIGFTWPIAFIVNLVESPAELYRGLLCYILVLQLLLMYVVYRIETRILMLGNLNAAIVSLLYTLGAMAPQAGIYYMTEVPFALCTMGLLYFILMANRTEGKVQILYYVLCGMVLAYSYTVHSRFLVLAVGTVLTIAVILFVFKRSKRNVIGFIATFALFFLICRRFVSYIQGTLYATTIGKNISGNDALTRLQYLPAYIEKILKMDNIVNLFVNLLSVMAATSLLTGGLFWIVLGNCFHETYQLLKEKKKDDISRAQILVNIYGSICFLGMTALVAWIGMMNSTETRWLTAYRYGRPFVGIFILTGLPALLEKSKKTQIYAFSSVGIIVSALTLITYTAQRVNSSERIEVSKVGWFGYYFFENQDVIEYFCMMSLIMFSLYLIYLFCIRKGYSILICAIYLLFSVMMIISENNYNVEKTKNDYLLVEQTYKAFQTLSFGNIDIYFHQTSYAGKLRYTFYDKKLNFVPSEEDCERIDYSNAVLLSDRPNLLEEWGINACRIKLAEWEYLYTNNEDIIQQANGGYEILY